MFSYNTSVHEGTRRTPYELVFGKIPIVPSSQPLPEYERLDTYDEYLVRLLSKLDSLQKEAKQNLEIAKQESKEYYDKKINPVKLEAGKYVFIRKGMKIGKLGDPNEGPYRILEVKDNKNVKLEIGKKEKLISIDRVIPTEIRN